MVQSQVKSVLFITNHNWPQGAWSHMRNHIHVHSMGEITPLGLSLASDVNVFHPLTPGRWPLLNGCCEISRNDLQSCLCSLVNLMCRLILLMSQVIWHLNQHLVSGPMKLERVVYMRRPPVLELCYDSQRFSALQTNRRGKTWWIKHMGITWHTFKTSSDLVYFINSFHLAKHTCKIIAR